MKFTWERESDDGFCTVIASPENYDAFPSVQVLAMDHIPRLVANDRLAVSCILSFGHYAGGAINLMSPVSAELADAAISMLAPASVAIPTVDYTPRAITYGTNMFKLNVDGEDTVDLQWHGFACPREFELRMVPMSDAYLSSFSDEILQVPTNAGLVIPYDAPADVRILPYVAQALLLAEDLDVGIIKLPAGIPRTPKLNNVARLLHACGLQLHFTE
ncbi:hypothetical protein [Arthrobacter sp. zg-Y179]|uniref:hypothetical protein n=1 Tax=Arthrobacter sp. zg-Y179 TaxID=2894188 RepID=UPI001E4BDA2E|nr:hypothetical protein [Arthrobacter sp. zg-Y179]MCC9174260.1 hypothetical protein [Arthrobacter sp. zg-Y179]